MRFPIGSTWGAAFLLSLLAGCASLDGRNSVARRDASTDGSRSASRTASAERRRTTDDDDRAPAARSGNSSGDSRPTVARTAASKPASTTNEPARKPAGSPKNGFNEATQTLIDEELADASPSEREALLKELTQVSPDMVPKILRVRRLNLQYQKKNGSTDTETEGTTEFASRRVDGHTSPVLTRDPRALRDPAPGSNITTLRQPETDDLPAPSGAPADKPATGDSRALSATNPWGGRGSSRAPTTHPLRADGAPTTSPSNWAIGGAARPRPSGVPGPPETGAPATPPAGSPAEAPAVADAGRPGNPNVPGAPAGGSQAVLNATQRALSHLAPGTGPVVPAGNNVPTGAPATDVRTAAHDRPASGTASRSDVLLLSGQVAPPADPPAGDAAAAWKQQLDRLISDTEAEVAGLKPGSNETEKQHYLERNVYLRMLYLMAGRQERAIQVIPGIEAADQEFWQKMLWSIVNYFDTQAIPARPDRATQTIEQLQLAIQRLQQKSNLMLRNVAFCQRINSFGSYERFPRDEFTPGQPVLLYAEVENALNEQTSDQQYRSILKSSIEVHRPGPQGGLVEKIEFKSTEDLCRNPRRDYYLSYTFTIPANLPVGPHTVKLIVEDQLSRKVATYDVNLTVR